MVTYVYGDPNLRFCLDTTLAWMLNSTFVWKGVKRPAPLPCVSTVHSPRSTGGSK